MRDEVPSSAGATRLRHSVYQVSVMGDFEFEWEDPELNMDAVFRPGIDTPFFSPSTFNDFEMGSMTENLILIDEHQEKENSLLFQQLQFSQRPTYSPVLMGSRPFGTRFENFCDYVYINSFACY